MNDLAMVTSLLEPSPNRLLVRSFLDAYWREDLATALTYCAPASVIELTRSIPILTPAPISVVLPLMFRDIYVRFENRSFAPEIMSILEDADKVLVEYVARGVLVNKCKFECAYAVVFTIRDCLIYHIHAYADTRYVAPLMLS